MQARDVRRLRSARRRDRPVVLFTRRPGWERSLRRSIRRATPFFYEIDEVDPYEFDLLIPLSLVAQEQIRETRSDALGRTTLVPSTRTEALCNDKLTFIRHLEEQGLGDFLPETGPGLGFPFVLKARVGEFGEGTTIIRCEEDAERAADGLDPDGYFTQGAIPGSEEYTTHFFARGGRVLFARTLAFSFDADLYVKGKALRDTSRRPVDHSHQNVMLSTIVEAIGYDGFGCVNYKLLDGAPKVFEVNPRVGGSFHHFADEAIEAYRNALPGWVSAA